MTKREYRLFGVNVLIWTWNEVRKGAKGKRGIGFIVEWNLTASKSV